MQPSRLTRLLWLLEDVWDLSPVARLRRRAHELRHTHAAKVVAGLLAVLLVCAGFLGARMVARAPASASPGTRVITVHQWLSRQAQGRPATQRLLSKVSAKGRTVIRTRTLRAGHGTRVVTATLAPAPVSGKTRTVLAPVTATQTHTSTSTRVVTVSRPVTVVKTTTVVALKTVSVPITITVTVP